MNLQRVSGRIENLRVVEDKRNILFGPQMQEAAGLSAIIFAAAGMGAAAVQTSSNADAADDVALYSFDIGGVRYAGCTRKASFKDGDEVEIVFEARRVGNEVLAVRRPKTKSIWLYPYMSRGSFSAIKHGLRLWIFWSIGGLLLVAMVGPLWDILRGDFSWVLELTTVAFALVGGVGLFLAPRFLRFARAADEVFATFGYPSPKSVDLHKTSKAHRKAHNLPYDALELWY